MNHRVADFIFYNLAVHSIQYTNCFFGVGGGFVPEGMRFSRFICMINRSYMNESILLVLAFRKVTYFTVSEMVM